MSRQARILAVLEAARFVPADDLAGELGVSRRTVASEIATLQDLLGTSASITMDDSRYRLMIADPQRYRAVRSSVDEDLSFNNPDVRCSYIVARLFRAFLPVRTDELAAAMAVGRTTVVTDLVRVRELLADDDLTVEGKPNVGLTISGPELQQRLHVLRHHFPLAYPADDVQRRVEEIVRERATAAGLEPVYIPELTRWSTVCIDRTKVARPIDYLPNRYAGLAATPAHELASDLADRLAREFNVSLDADERIFLTLPIAGMRAPSDAELATRLSGSTGTDALVGDVLGAVRAEMDIDLTATAFLSEFARHLAYMLNRMRYRIWLDDTDVADVRAEFPVAYRMATVAGRVIESHVGLPIEEAELGFLATYFQVFLEARDRAASFLHVVVVASTGRVSAELVRLQLAKLLPGSTQLDVLSHAEATPELLAQADLVVVAGDADVQTSTPVLEVTRVLDRGALERQLERLQLRIPLGSGVGRGSSVLAGAIDERHFFALPAGTEYDDAVDYMTGHLEARGLVERGFGDRIREREARAQTQLDPWVGFPHASITQQRGVMLAVAVIPREPADDGVRLIVLLGVPAASTHSEDVLVQVYDEVLRLGARRDLLDQLCQLTTFEQFYYFLEKNPTTER
ncbi:MAG: PRD domain-containing protein [Propionibacteriaceae bacterium]|nr:PRD domain-containing protein [Propionibacteriaceae bacterium]